MAWTKGDHTWHYVEVDGVRRPPFTTRPLSKTTCGMFLARPPDPAPTDSDPKCPTCSAAHP